jgi:hypothetical protein
MAGKDADRRCGCAIFRGSYSGVLQAAFARAERKVALVIGDAAYKLGPLANL